MPNHLTVVPDVPRAEHAPPPRAGAELEFARLDPLLTLDQVRKLTSWSRTSIYRKIDDGTFPRPIKLGECRRDPKRGRIAWRASELVAWIDSRPRAA